MHFFRNATTAPTAYGRGKQVAIDVTATNSTTFTVRGTASGLISSGQYEFDVGNGFIRRATHSADIAGDISAQGVNGRDSVGALAGNSWGYFYALLKTSDLTTVAFVVSANPPATGPVLANALSAYQSPMFCGAVRINGAGNFARGYRRNDIWRYASSLSDGLISTVTTLPTTEQTAALATVVPPTAVLWVLHSLTQLVTAVVANSAQLELRNITALASLRCNGVVIETANQPAVADDNDIVMPCLTTQDYRYLWLVTGTQAAGTSGVHYCSGYVEPIT